MAATADHSELIDQVSDLRDSAREYADTYKTEIESAHGKNQVSAANLAHYLGVRSHDLRELQDKLHGIAVSTLVGTESHVLAGLECVSRVLHGLRDSRDYRSRKVLVTADKGHKQLRRNTNRLLGKKLKGAPTRIMVTLPSEAASDPDLVHDLVTTGMSVARINCAHDGPALWLRMIANVGKARARTGRSCKIAMDLTGPKLRTGAIQPGPCVARLRPRRDALGRIVHRARVVLGPRELAPQHRGDETFLPVPEDWSVQLRAGDAVRFRDTRGKLCTLTVDGAEGGVAHAECNKSAYVMSGTQLDLERPDDSSNRRVSIGDLPPTEQALILARGDTLILTRDQNPGAPAVRDAAGNMVAPAFVPCTLPEVFGKLAVGDPISFDDGRIDGVIRGVDEGELEIEITYARGGAARLRADKGINFPRSRLGLRGLTQRDRTDLEFVVKHADIVNLSFVNRPEDVRDLVWELGRLGADKLGVIVKVETMSAFHNLPQILFEALKHRPVGVMIARGDLAVEAGWKNLAKIQEEMIWMCEAAHLPIVWATQVLESLAKRGTPSRAEIADVVMAQRSACVMLNKGPHILEAVRFLDLMLQSMAQYVGHGATAWPALELTEDWANISYTSPGYAVAKLDLKSRKEKKSRNR